MRRFIVGFFASIGLIVVLFFAAALAIVFFAAPGTPQLAAANILTLDLTAPLSDAAASDGLARLVLAERPSLRDVLEGLERAGDDPRVKGLVARLGDGEFGTAQVQELRDAIAAFRAKGKFAIAYGDSFGEFGSGMRSYYLATAFDEIWLQPLGMVGLVGLRAEVPFFRGTLDKLGVAPRFDHRSEYKTAMNVVTETAMTPAHREETEALLHSVYDQMVRGIAAGRHLDESAVRQLVDRGPFEVAEAAEAHLIDHTGYRDDAVNDARKRGGDNAQLVSLSHYVERAGGLHRHGPVVALIHADGLIQRGESSSNPLSGASVTGADTVTRAFRKAAEDPDVRAILFRIDSPGGSAVASETIWRETLRAKEAGKPVIVSMGNVAGSGGYYIAAAADKIVAEPATLTGSIGVVAGKMLVGGLSEKLGVSWDATQIGVNAGMFSSIEDFSPEGHRRFEQFLDTVYAGFKDRVAQGRKLDADAVERVARGRVWTGEDAKAQGLIDALGGYDRALVLVKEAAHIAPQEDVTLKPFPAPETPAATLARLLGRGTEPEEGGTETRLAVLERSLEALRPLLQEIELMAAPPGTLTMAPMELR